MHFIVHNHWIKLRNKSGTKWLHVPSSTKWLKHFSHSVAQAESEEERSTSSPLSHLSCEYSVAKSLGHSSKKLELQTCQWSQERRLLAKSSDQCHRMFGRTLKHSWRSDRSHQSLSVPGLMPSAFTRQTSNPQNRLKSLRAYSEFKHFGFTIWMTLDLNQDLSFLNWGTESP